MALGAVSATTVASVESVGAILVVALLIAPADKLKVVLVLAISVGVLASVSGYYLAVWRVGRLRGAIAMMAGALFLLSLLLSPTHGILFRKRRFSATPEPSQTR